MSSNLESLESRVGALWLPGMSEADWNDEVEAMLDRTYIVNQFMQGNVEVDSFLDWIAQNYADPMAVFDGMWVPG